MAGIESLLSALCGCYFAFGISLAVKQPEQVTQILHAVHVRDPTTPTGLHLYPQWSLETESPADSRTCEMHQCN